MGYILMKLKLATIALLNNVSAVLIQREITDEDGDGVEDNVKLTSHQIEQFYKPAVFKHAEEMHNTRNGELPGHHLKEDHPEPGVHAATIIDVESGEPVAVQLRMDDLSNNFYDEEY